MEERCLDVMDAYLGHDRELAEGLRIGVPGHVTHALVPNVTMGLFRVNINLSNGDFSATQYSQLTPADQSAPDLYHISIAANLANPLQVYVGMSESGVWLVTASTATRVFGVDGSGTHGDSRYMVFDANGDLLQADDGGIWRLHSPGPNQTWQAMDGNLNITEVYTIDYDLTHKTVVGGAQDQGDFYQTAPGVLPQPQTEGGDGGVTYVDNTSSGGPYYSDLSQMNATWGLGCHSKE
jgi:hypothetical protein